MDDIDDLLSKIDDPEEQIDSNVDLEAIEGEETYDDIEEGLSQDDKKTLKNLTESASESKEIPETVKIRDEPGAGNAAKAGQAKQQISPALPAFTLRGTRSWNTREPYIISLNPENLARDRKDLKSSFFFNMEQIADDQLKEKIKDHLLSFVRRPSKNIQQEYEHFIYGELAAETDKTAGEFQFAGDIKSLFIYHLGPLTLYRMIGSLFHKRKIAFCYKLESGNKSVRYFPDEFIKEKVVIWYEQNINSLNLPFDSIQHLNDIKSVIAKKYTGDVKKFNHTLEDVNARIAPDKSISRERLLNLKGDDIFGIVEIEVYKRFIERTIFHRGI